MRTKKDTKKAAKSKPSIACVECGKKQGEKLVGAMFETVDMVDYLGLTICNSCVYERITASVKKPLSKHYSSDDKKWAQWFKDNPPAKLGIDVKLELKS